MVKNNLNYTGTVNIFKYKKKKLVETRTLKNEGTTNLFTLICNSLNKFYVASDNPTYIDVVVRDSATGGFTSILYTPPFIYDSYVTPGEGETGSSSVTFQAALTADYLKQDLVEGEEVYYALRSAVTGNTNEDSLVLAYVDTGVSTSSFKIALDEVYVIYWNLEIGNSETQTSTLNVTREQY